MGVFYTKLFRKEIVGNLHLKKGNTFIASDSEKFFMGKINILSIDFSKSHWNFFLLFAFFLTNQYDVVSLHSLSLGTRRAISKNLGISSFLTLTDFIYHCYLAFFNLWCPTCRSQ